MDNLKKRKFSKDNNTADKEKGRVRVLHFNMCVHLFFNMHFGPQTNMNPPNICYIVKDGQIVQQIDHREKVKQKSD